MKVHIKVFDSVGWLYKHACKKADSENFVYLKIMNKSQYKSDKQNRTFHSLLQCFWLSGCSSFKDYDELRLYYKDIAGLVIRSIKDEKQHIQERSWSDVKKIDAKASIESLLRDMDASGVIVSEVAGAKYKEILQGLGEIV